MKPLLKWVGGKQKVAPFLGQFWRRKDYNRLIEPFAGAASLFFEVLPDKAIMTDTCWPLVDFYQTLQKFDKRVATSWRSLLAARGISKESYYAVRSAYNKCLHKTGKMSSTVEIAIRRASRFLYLNRLGFQGLWRVNRSGSMNVPFGGYANPKLPGSEDIAVAASSLQNVKVIPSGFEVALNIADKGDLVYCDPPYYSTYAGYTSEMFDSESHHVMLGALCDAAVRRGADVMVSNSEMAAKFFTGSGWLKIAMPRGQSIAPHNGGRKSESLFISKGVKLK